MAWSTRGFQVCWARRWALAQRRAMRPARMPSSGRDVDGADGALEVPDAPEAAGAGAGLGPLGWDVVLVLLRGHQAVLGEVRRDPARVGRAQALGVVQGGPGEFVAAALLGVGVVDDVGPRPRRATRRSVSPVVGRGRGAGCRACARAGRRGAGTPASTRTPTPRPRRGRSACAAPSCAA